MKNCKIKMVSLLCGLSFLLGSGCVAEKTEAFRREYSVNDFNVKISPYHTHGRDKLCEIEIWSKNNKEIYPSDTKDGDVDISYIYNPSSEYSSSEWTKTVHKWKKTKDHVFESGTNTGSYFYTISYEDVPGKPRGILLDTFLEFRVDFDKNEEYARGIFKDVKSAEDWADNMIKIFQTNDEGGKRKWQN